MCSTQYLTRSRRSLMRYRVANEKRNSISPRADVYILYNYITTVCSRKIDHPKGPILSVGWSLSNPNIISRDNSKFKPFKNLPGRSLFPSSLPKLPCVVMSSRFFLIYPQFNKPAFHLPSPSTSSCFHLPQTPGRPSKMKALVPHKPLGDPQKWRLSFPINPWETLENEGSCSLVPQNPWETLENEGSCSFVSPKPPGLSKMKVWAQGPIRWLRPYEKETVIV